MFCLADNDTTILHNVLGLDKYIATVHMLDFSLLVLVEGGKDDKILRAWDGGQMCIFIPDICKPFIVTRKKNHKKKRDVGMVCQKVHKQRRIKVMVNIQSLIHPYIFSQKSKDVGIGLCIFTITFILPCLCIFWHAIQARRQGG